MKYVEGALLEWTVVGRGVYLVLLQQPFHGSRSCDHFLYNLKDAG